jgi:hypothetical protein
MHAPAIRKAAPKPSMGSLLPLRRLLLRVDMIHLLKETADSPP